MGEKYMNRSTLFNTIRACAILAVTLPFLISEASAGTVGPNWTQTNYDANSGAVQFDWDPNSQYDIVDTEVTVLSHNISGFTGGVVGTVFEFVIPNFYDPEPIKKIWITMSGANSGAQGSDIPYVLDIIGGDAPYGQIGPSKPVYGSLVDGTKTPNVVTEYWEMFPNPDFEVVKLYVPTTFELQRIIIDTQSTAIPIPPSVLLFGSGILGLVGIARRKVSV
jgi:hypothetical protein